MAYNWKEVASHLGTDSAKHVAEPIGRASWSCALLAITVCYHIAFYHCSGSSIVARIPSMRLSKPSSSCPLCDNAIVDNLREERLFKGQGP